MSSRLAPSKVSTARSANGRKVRRHNVPEAYTPGTTPRKEAKALDSGAWVEAHSHKILSGRKVGLDCWRRPGIAFERLTGVRYRPDAAAYIPELAGLSVERIPEVRDTRPTYNIFIEYKGQSSTGSAYLKIDTAILDVAHASDDTGTVGAVILDVPVLDRGIVEGYKALGRLHSVVVLEIDEVRKDPTLLVTEAVRVAKERKRLARRIGPKGGFTPTKRPPIAEIGLQARWSGRRMSGYKLNEMGITTLSK